MTKIYCDRCGAECVNYHVSFNVHEVHTTNRGEYLESEEVNYRKDQQLCGVCSALLQVWFGSRDLGLTRPEEIAGRQHRREAEKQAYRIADPPLHEAGGAVVRAHP